MGNLTIGIIGGGVGGMAAAIALRRHGHQVRVYEQAGQFARVGADINLTPNAVRALDGLGHGVGAALMRLVMVMFIVRPPCFRSLQSSRRHRPGRSARARR